MAIQERSIPASLKLQQSPLRKVSGTERNVCRTEVIFWRKGKWRGKRYGFDHNGDYREFFPVAPDFTVTIPGKKRRKGLKVRPPVSEVNHFPELLSCYPCNANSPVPAIQKKGKKRKRSLRQAKEDAIKDFRPYPPPTPFHKYNDFVPLQEAIRRQMVSDPPPTRQYLHLGSYQPITMGEWMLSVGRHAPDRVPLDYSWLRLLDERVSRKEISFVWRERERVTQQHLLFPSILVALPQSNRC